MTDPEIAPSMRRTVALLRANGFVVQKVFGETDETRASVSVLVPAGMLADEAARMHGILKARGIVFPTVDEDEGENEPFIQATYDPTSPEAGAIDLVNVGDAQLPLEKAS